MLKNDCDPSAHDFISASASWFTSRSWQQRFAHIVQEIRNFNVDTTLERKVAVNVDLVGLTNDFIHTVDLYGKIIVSVEYFLF